MTCYIIFIVPLTHSSVEPTENIVVLVGPPGWKIYNVILKNPPLQVIKI